MHPHLWHPYTQAKTAPEPLKVKSAQGVWLELEDGTRLIDCISSWWVTLHGHAQPEIAEAIYQQAKQLEQVIFAGFTHDPAEQLADALIEILPAPLNRVFFSDNGSTAVEVALKMAYQYWRNQGQSRQKFLAFEGGYHGDTVGTMSASARSLFSQVFSDLLFEVEFVPFPATHWGDAAVEEKEAAAIAAIEQKLQSAEFAAMIVEPLVQGASGMRMCRLEFLQQVRQITQTHKTLLIADEVMTGFGRTGDWFACKKAAIAPDLICLSKGLTGGFLPMSVTVCTEEIYAAFYSNDPLKTLYHGHSYTANPLGCAAAIASLNLLKVNPSFKDMEAKHRQHLSALQADPRLERLRVMGTIAAMDIVTSEQQGYLNQVGLAVRKQAIDRKLLLRPLGNVLYLLPPYCITDEELAFVYEGISAILTAIALS
ncbi:adenosylmethionine--8-amino-7-oxononanoate transaminase [Microcoleus sp. FACHB-1515]|uniref:adenosylmethionine--8-amino-7-oxononanoate transaminase n=1 Tax=Cyanophyceae TaxID=3028117 RepID=UPI001685AA80|nr:adenosylmethionine--8-amino-7-oxononanoate transaminase [Microcoleus sp. FACHB-1515]MBD2088744.1 adenosylmethionine--8-amino-7-oxononanoate transaminase [Microcoleus sp. FACHB-1515]